MGPPPVSTTATTVNAVTGQRELRNFRTGFYGCLTGWPDAAFELTDAMLCSPSPVASVPTLSLEPAFRRSHGSLYKALDRGEVDDQALRDLLVDNRPRAWPLVFAVDASTWARCDAETSPERGFCYSASKHSAGQPIVAGWSYQWVTGLDWANDSWTAPMDARRISPNSNTNQVTVAQITDLTQRHHRSDPTGPVPTFVFDAGYDPAALTHELTDVAVGIVVRIRDDRVFYGDPTPTSAGTRGRPRRHGPKIKLADPGTWPTPDLESATTDDRYGTVKVSAWRDLHPKLGRRGHWAEHHEPPIVLRHRGPSRCRAPAQTHQPDQEDAMAVGRGTPPGPRHRLASLPAPLRHRAHLPVPQKHPGLDHSRDAYPRTGRPMDLARPRRLHPNATRPQPGRRPPPALGTTTKTPPTHTRPRPARISTTCPHTRHSCQSTKNPDPRPGTTQGNPETATDPLPSGQEGRIARFNRKFRAAPFRAAPFRARPVRDDSAGCNVCGQDPSELRMVGLRAPARDAA